MESASFTTYRPVAVSVPGAVWFDFLDPQATTMQAEIELPEPRIVKRGKGFSFIYENVTVEQARELAHYLRSRGELLLGNSDPESESIERGWYRSAIKTADRIEAGLR